MRASRAASEIPQQYANECASDNQAAGLHGVCRAHQREGRQCDEGDIERKNAADDLIDRIAAYQTTLVKMAAVGLRDALASAQPTQQRDGGIGNVIKRPTHTYK